MRRKAGCFSRVDRLETRGEQWLRILIGRPVLPVWADRATPQGGIYSRGHVVEERLSSSLRENREGPELQAEGIHKGPPACENWS